MTHNIIHQIIVRSDGLDHRDLQRAVTAALQQLEHTYAIPEEYTAVIIIAPDTRHINLTEAEVYRTYAVDGTLFEDTSA